MTSIIIAESVNVTENEVHILSIDMIDVDTLLFNIMNTDTGINYRLYIKKESDWCKENLYKTQNDFSQLYKMLEDCIVNEESMFTHTIQEQKENINFKMSMKKETKFFKLDLELILERHISDDGMTSDRLNSLEYQLNIYKDKTDETINKLQEDNNVLIKQVYELMNFKLKLQEKNKKEYDWLNTEWFRDKDPRLPPVNCGAERTRRNVILLTGQDKGGTNVLPSGTFISQLQMSCPNPVKYDKIINISYILKESTGADYNKMFKSWFDHHMETLQV